MSRRTEGSAIVGYGLTQEQSTFRIDLRRIFVSVGVLEQGIDIEKDMAEAVRFPIEGAEETGHVPFLDIAGNLVVFQDHLGSVFHVSGVSVKSRKRGERPSKEGSLKLTIVVSLAESSRFSK